MVTAVVIVMVTVGFGGCLEVWRLAGSRRARHADRSRGSKR